MTATVADVELGFVLEVTLLVEGTTGYSLLFAYVAEATPGDVPQQFVDSFELIEVVATTDG